MRKILAIGISSGIIAVLWTAGSVTLGLSTVAGFLAWSSFFAAGGSRKGIKKALIANLSGICWGVITFQLSKMLAFKFGDVGSMTIFNGLGSAGIILQSKITLLSFIPASFIGWSAFIASGMNFKVTVISMIIGSFAGYSSEKLTDIILNIFTNECIEKNVEADTQLD